MVVIFFVFVLFGWGVYAGDCSSSEESKTIEEYYLQGKEYILEGNYEKANECFKKAEALLDEEGEIARTKEVSTLKKEKVQASTVLSEHVFAQADDAFQRNNFDKSLNLYKTVIETSPEDYNAYYNVGVIYLKKREYQNAAAAFKKVVELHPRDADACYNLGVIYEDFIDDSKQALRYYKTYIQMNPRAQDCHLVKKWIKYIEQNTIKK